jgi:hypothetical protein
MKGTTSMRWRMYIGYIVIAILLFIQMGINTAITPSVFAEESIATYTPTPTPTPANGDCNDFQCGLH